MGYQHITLNFEMLWVRAFTLLVVNGETAELIAKNGGDQVMVTLRGVSDHTIADQTHTFQTLVKVDGEPHIGRVTATFKEGTNREVLFGQIEYDLYPQDNLSEKSEV